MGRQSLAVKYRPSTFEELVEQDSIKIILTEQLATNSFKNCYLFTGPAGCGKTSSARIFANAINNYQGSPIEIDAASNNGVDNVREIIDNAKFKAMDAEHKVYIIDEVHMLSPGAWAAMLKLLEEPPARTIFILCTTDPQKIPATILSRVQRYDFKRISFYAIVERLKIILQKESKENSADPAALEFIAKISDGGMRDAITLLDKASSFSEELTLENVVTALGSIQYQTMFELTDHILYMQQSEAIGLIEESYRNGLDLKQFVKQYVLFLLDLCKYGLFGSFDYLQIPSIFGEQINKYVTEDYQYFRKMLDTFMQLQNEIKWEQSCKPLIETTILLLSQE